MLVGNVVFELAFQVNLIRFRKFKKTFQTLYHRTCQIQLYKIHSYIRNGQFLTFLVLKMKKYLLFGSRVPCENFKKILKFRKILDSRIPENSSVNELFQNLIRVCVSPFFAILHASVCYIELAYSHTEWF